MANITKPSLWCPGINLSHPLAGRHEGLWPLWEGGGSTTMDLSGNSLNGTLTNLDPSTDWVMRNIGLGIEFPGQSDPAEYIDVGTCPTLTKWTVWAIVNPDRVIKYSTNSGMVILSQDRSGWNNDVLFGIVPEGSVQSVNRRFALIHQEPVTEVRTVVQDDINAVIGRTYFVAVTSDGASLRLYVDGVLKGTTAKAGTALTLDGAPLRIGAPPGADTIRGWDGIIHAAGLSGECFTAGQIRALSRDPWEFLRPEAELPVLVEATSGAVFLISGSVAGMATASGTLIGTGALAGASAGLATTQGTLMGSGALAGAAAGLATAQGALTGTGALAGASAGTCAASGTLSALGALAGLAAGTCTASGILSGGPGILYSHALRVANLSPTLTVTCMET